MNEPSPQRPTTYETFATASGDNSSSGENAASGDNRSPIRRDELLAKVMGETLNRRHEDAGLLVEALRAWRSELASHDVDSSNPDASDTDVPWDANTCEQLVTQVLRFRLGDVATELPAQLLQDVAQTLWNNPDGRKRMERIWDSLGKP